jgi:HEPN domain-containing protein
MKTKGELIGAWLEKAEKDLLSANHEFSFKDRVLESICFHCQQAVEKYIKAYLIYLEITFGKTHEIGELITLCEHKDTSISALKEEADKLTDYSVDLRYPDDALFIDIKDAREAIEIALKVKNFVLKNINPTGLRTDIK